MLMHLNPDGYAILSHTFLYFSTYSLPFIGYIQVQSNEIDRGKVYLSVYFNFNFFIFLKCSSYINTNAYIQNIIMFETNDHDDELRCK